MSSMQSNYISGRLRFEYLNIQNIDTGVANIPFKIEFDLAIIEFIITDLVGLVS